MTRTWLGWRGSVKLLAHVAARASQCVSQHTGAQAVPMRIVVDLGADREVFATVEDFHGRVTQEALRRFKRILVTVGRPNGGVGIAVDIQREGRLWKTGSVWLTIGAPNQTVMKDVDQVMTAALERGYTFSVKWRHPPWIWIVILLSSMLGSFTLVMLVQLWSTESWVPLVVAAIVFGLSINILIEVLMPAVEIAQEGKVRLARAGSALLPVVGVLAKWLLG